jgi:hypothetical protein
MPGSFGYFFIRLCDSLDVGGVHGDAIRPVTGHISYLRSNNILATDGGAMYYNSSSEHVCSAEESRAGKSDPRFDISRVHPVANKVQPRAFGVLACVYLGKPAAS